MAGGRREATSQESRRMLISAAAEMFAEKGFRATTFQDVADRAGISRGSIPWHFGNKEGLLEAVIDDFTAAAFTDTAALNSIDAVLDEVVDLFRRPTGKLLMTLVAEAVEPDSPLSSYYRDLQVSMRKWLSEHLSGVTLPQGVDRDAFVTIILASTIGLHQQWRVAPDEIDLDAAISALKVIFTAPAARARRRAKT